MGTTKDNASEMATMFVIIVLAFLAAIVAIAYGIGKSEKAECRKWQEQAKQYPGFYVTDWQKRQCEANDLPFDASVPVK